MTTTMVFLHGRGQEFKDPGNLMASWRSGLAAGLVRAGRPALDTAPAVLPFYANVLYQVTAELERTGSPVDLESLHADEAGPLHPALSRDVGAVEREMMADLAAAAGTRPGATGAAAEAAEVTGFRQRAAQRALSWRGVRTALIMVAKTGNVDREVIKGLLKDVAVYLAGAGARDKVLSVVRAGLPDGRIVLVTHSLGTVVGCDLLADPAIRQRTAGWVTLGAPLGLPAVQRNLLVKGAHHPDGIDWLTAYDTNDVVALGHPLQSAWGKPLADIEVENGDAPHSIERYLGHPQVADFISAKVTAP
jgi:hypothetical protein